MNCFPSLASTKVSSVKLQLIEHASEPGTVNRAELICNSSEYEITWYDMSQEYSEWTPGRMVMYTVTVESKPGFYFTRRETVPLVSNGKILSKNISSSKLELIIAYTPTITLAEPHHFVFEKDCIAKWDEIPYAFAYEVRVYKNGKFAKTIKTRKAELDISEYMTTNDKITFDVKAVPRSEDEAAFIHESSYAVCENVPTFSSNISDGKFYGDYDNMTFRDADGSLVEGWQQIDESLYYFDPDNDKKAICDDFALIDGKWYHFNDKCIMQTGWLKIKDAWYYFNSSGEMATGWICMGPSGGPWYYFDETTGMLWHDRYTPDGYYVGSNGAWYAEENEEK